MTWLHSRNVSSQEYDITWTLCKLRVAASLPDAASLSMSAVPSSRPASGRPADTDAAYKLSRIATNVSARQLPTILCGRTGKSVLVVAYFKIYGSVTSTVQFESATVFT